MAWHGLRAAYLADDTTGMLHPYWKYNDCVCITVMTSSFALNPKLLACSALTPQHSEPSLLAPHSAKAKDINLRRPQSYPAYPPCRPLSNSRL